MARIEATVDPANDPSKRVLEKIGMTYVGQIGEAPDALSDLFAIERGAPR
jgi:RimJ/RimL family protein N-acetyltransferase